MEIWGAGRAFARAPSRANDTPIRQHHRQRQYVFAHRAVAHGIGARSPRGGHPAQGSLGSSARVDREKQAAIAQVLIELLEGDAGFDRGVEIIRTDLQDPVRTVNHQVIVPFAAALVLRLT